MKLSHSSQLCSQESCTVRMELWTSWGMLLRSTQCQQASHSLLKIQLTQLLCHQTHSTCQIRMTLALWLASKCLQHLGHLPLTLSLNADCLRTFWHTHQLGSSQDVQLTHWTKVVQELLSHEESQRHLQAMTACSMLALLSQSMDMLSRSHVNTHLS